MLRVIQRQSAVESNFLLRRGQAAWSSRHMATISLKAVDESDVGIYLQEDVKPYLAVPEAPKKWFSGINFIKRPFQSKVDITESILSNHQEVMREYGPVVKIRKRYGEEVWISNPQDIATVFRAESKYPERGKFQAAEIFHNKFNKQRGIFFLNGKEWYKHRSVISKKMLRPPEMEKYIQRFDAIANEMLVRISQVRNPEGHEQQFEIDNLQQELFHYSFENVTSLIFDRRFGAISDSPSPDAVDFLSHIDGFVSSIVPVSVIPPIIYKFYEPKVYKKFINSYLGLYTYTEKLIQEKIDQLDQRLKSGSLDIKTDESPEFISFLLGSNKIQPNELCSSIVDTLFAGLDTTSNTLLWMIYLLSKNQDKQEVLRKELDQFTPSVSQLTSNNLAQLAYLKATIKETMRLYPVLITNSRILAEDVVLSGYRIPAGKKLVFLNHAMWRRPELFDAPNDFRPERWLRDSKDSKIASFSFLPFGHGVRMCLGRRVAELQLQLLTVKILQSYKLRYATDEDVKHYLRGTLVPDRPLRVIFEKRQ